MIALFVALGGTGYALTVPKNSIGPKQLRTGAVTSKDIRQGAVQTTDIRNSTVRGADVRAESLGGREIVESALGTVPRAASADSVGGLTAAQLKDRCPGGTNYTAGTCIEAAARAPESFLLANNTCSLAGRNLVTYAQLANFYSAARPVSSGGEWTSNVGPEGGSLVAVVIQNTTGSSVTFSDAISPTPHAFRCGAPLTNL